MMRSVQLKIDGMRCQGCAQTLQSVLKRAPGVREVKVSFEDKVARVLVDDPRPDVQRLVALVEQAGYAAQPEREETP